MCWRYWLLTLAAATIATAIVIDCRCRWIQHLRLRSESTQWIIRKCCWSNFFNLKRLEFGHSLMRHIDDTLSAALFYLQPNCRSNGIILVLHFFLLSLPSKIDYHHNHRYKTMVDGSLSCPLKYNWIMLIKIRKRMNAKFLEEKKIRTRNYQNDRGKQFH